MINIEKIIFNLTYVYILYIRFINVIDYIYYFNLIYYNSRELDAEIVYIYQ